MKPLAGLTKLLSLLLKANIALSVVAVLGSLNSYYEYANLPSGTDSSEVSLSSDLITFVIGLSQIVMFIIVGIAFLRWIHRTNKNLSMFSGEKMAFTPAWAAGWYFVPIANLYKPYQAMKEIWKASHKNEAMTYVLLKWWWALWIASNAIGRLSGRLGFAADDTEGYMVSAVAFVISDGFDVILCVVALALVTRIGAAYSRNIVEKIGVNQSSPL